MAQPSYVEKLAELLRDTPKKVQVTFSCLLNIYCLPSSENYDQTHSGDCLAPRTTQNSLEKVVNTKIICLSPAGQLPGVQVHPGAHAPSHRGDAQL